MYQNLLAYVPKEREQDREGGERERERDGERKQEGEREGTVRVDEKVREKNKMREKTSMTCDCAYLTTVSKHRLNMQNLK